MTLTYESSESKIPISSAAFFFQLLLSMALRCCRSKDSMSLASRTRSRTIRITFASVGNIGRSSSRGEKFEFKNYNASKIS